MKPKAGEPQKPVLSEALLDALASIQKSHGEGSIMRMGDRNEVPIEGISTGSLGLDLAIGGKGLPRGRVIEIFGPESSGKTTLTLHVIANAQKQGGICAFIDAEHALDPQYAKRLGVDLDALLISQPDNGEQALDICETLAKSGAIDVIVIDSVAALVPKAEIEGEMGDSFVGLHARLMSQALRKLTALTARTKTTLIFINQIREKIGVMFGSPETTTGGRALKFYSSVRIDIRRIGQIKDGEEPIGARTKATVVKNKIAPPFKKCEFDILFAEGINRLGEILDLGVESAFLKRSGTWISHGETRLGQGREKAREFLKENPALAKEIEDAFLGFMGKRAADKLASGAPASSTPSVSSDGARPAGAGAPVPASTGAAGRPGSMPARPQSGPAPKQATHDD
ncbi:MAG: recombinase RecA [Planctomycetes bacterium]|nr:recombinase RecA [Planctomycetota bacterium]